MLMNYIAIYFVSYLVQDLLRCRIALPPVSPYLRKCQTTIYYSDRLHAGFLIVLALAVLLWWAFNKTTFGFQIRGVIQQSHGIWWN